MRSIFDIPIIGIIEPTAKYVKEMEYKKIGLNVLFYRRAKGWTQQQLSTQSSVSRSRISDIERGREAIKLETLMMLANALEIDYRVLLESKEQ